MIVIEYNVMDDVEENSFLPVNDDVHEINKVTYDEERFAMMELEMIDWLSRIDGDWHEIYVHLSLILNMTKDFRRMNAQNNINLD